jgi:hypothetical protein
MRSAAALLRLRIHRLWLALAPGALDHAGRAAFSDDETDFWKRRVTAQEVKIGNQALSISRTYRQ